MNPSPAHQGPPDHKAPQDPQENAAPPAKPGPPDATANPDPAAKPAPPAQPAPKDHPDPAAPKDHPDPAEQTAPPDPPETPAHPAKPANPTNSQTALSDHAAFPNHPRTTSSAPKYVTVADDIARVKAMIKAALPDYPGLPHLRAHLAELENQQHHERQPSTKTSTAPAPTSPPATSSN